ncbi:MAG TPA: CHRD domain-containing protein [Candidatus Dormibacteraeota bacterium]
MISTRTGRGVFGALAAAAALAACGGSAPPPSAQPSAGGGAAAATKASAQLAHVPTGTATIAYDAGTQVLTVSLHVTGAAPKVAMPSHIHKGTCAGAPGDILYTLNPGMPDDKGVVDVTTKVPNVPAVPTGAYVHFHTGPTTGTPAEKKSIVCADLTGHPGQLAMGPNGAAGDNVTGTATLIRDPGTRELTVKVVLDGLEPSTSHPAHIHNGRCEAQGSVAIPLTALQADAKGHAESTTTVKDAPEFGTWYVNVHRGPGLNGPEFTPISCGNVVAS